MQLQLSQPDIVVAIKDHLSKMGINREVKDIDFTVARKGTDKVTADIEFVPVGATAEATQVLPPEEPVEVTTGETVDTAANDESPESEAVEDEECLFASDA